MTEIPSLSATDMAAAIREKRISPFEVVEAALGRIQERQELNAFMAVCADRARDEGRHAESAVIRGDALGTLHGLPFSVKDLTNTAGVATTNGSALFADNVPAEDAVAVGRARAAGAILIGKTTTPEFGHKAFTEGPFFGRTINPWDHRHTCGGSSGGAAVAVATGMGPFALGTDGGGSIRIPAACCGVVGFKATLGTIANLQAPDLFGASSYVGPMARKVADARLMFDAISGPDRRDPYGQHAFPLELKPERRPVRLGWLLSCGNVVDPEVEQVTVRAMEEAESLSMVVEPIDIDFVSLEPHFLVILQSALLARLGRYRRERADLLDPTLIATMDAAAGLTAVHLWEAQFARTACFLKIQALFERVDLIASPTLSAPALPIGLDPLGDIEIAGHCAGKIRAAWYPYTYPFNLTGHPAISLPCGLSGSGLPIGLQLVGRWNDDLLVLETAERLEAAFGFDGGHILDRETDTCSNPCA